MNKKEVLAALIDEKKAAVLRAILSSKEEMYLKEIALKSKVPLTSAFRILQELTEKKILQRREWKTSKVYGCVKNEAADFLRDLLEEEYDGVQDFVQSVQLVSGIQNILLHGGSRKGRANVMLIGENIDVVKVEEACKAIREKGFELSFLTLTKVQYEQMLRMGLYSGEKVVLR